MLPTRIIAIPVIVLFSMITACLGGANESEHSFEYVPLSQFTIDSNIIKPGSPVRIIAYSGGKESRKNNINYFQFIVVNQESGDTVKVLAPLINVPGEKESAQGTYTSPTMFDGNKGIFDATFEARDSTQSMMINLASVAEGKDSDLQAMKEIVTDTSNTIAGNEWVVVNKSLRIFERGKYKTTVGILKFSAIPW